MITAKSRLSVALCALMSLSACAYTTHEQLVALNYAVPSGSPFVQRLAVEYRDMANQGDDAGLFSRKGLEAASGKAVLPENPDDWSVAGDDADGMKQGRQTLIDLLDHGGRDLAPEFSAVAQARFDCWVEQAGGLFANADGATICRAEFKQALDQARAEVNKPAPASMPNNYDALHAAKFLVFFDWNKAGVTHAADKVIATAISESKRLGATQIDVVGNADKSGTERYNQALSLKRALAVKAKLIAMGIPAGEITTGAHGDDTPIVETARGVREPANRRVEIHFE